MIQTNQSGANTPLRKIEMAFDINSTLSPIIAGVIAILPLFLDLVVAMVPIVIVLAVVAFLLGFFDKILGMIKI